MNYLEKICCRWIAALFAVHIEASQSVSSVDQSCLSLCNLMDYSMPGFPVHHQLLELAQIHVNRVGDAIQPSHPVIPFSSFLQSFLESASFLMSQFFKSGSQVLELQLQHWSFLNRNWFPLGWPSWISFQSKGFSSLLQHHSPKASVLQCSALFTVQLSHPYMTTGKTIALIRWTFVDKVMSLLFNTVSRLVIAFVPRSKCLLI